MHNLIYCPPLIIRKLLPAFQWESKTDKILLTFDDGPTDSVLGRILDFLDQNRISAAFFLVGANAAKNPDLVKELVDGGHLVANHTENHQDVILCSKAKIHAEIDGCSKSLRETADQKTVYFRPPHGRFDWRTAGILLDKQLSCVMWSLLTADFKGDRSLSCGLVKKYLRANSIVTLHDNVKSAETVIPVLETILETAAKKGFTIGTPQQCLR